MNARVEKDWGRTLEELRRWAQQTEGVSISPTKMSVGSTVRKEFYNRVAAVQVSLTHMMLGNRLNEAERLAAAVKSVRQAICEQSGLSCYALAPRLEQFVDDPASTAAEPLQGLVLDVVAGVVPLAEVDGRARLLVRPAFEILLRAAYEAWVFFGVVADLDPVRFWNVVPSNGGSVQLVLAHEVRAGWQIPSRELRMPETVFESRDGTLYALKMECAREIDYYDALAPLARDTSAGGDTYEMITHRVLLLYRMSSLEAVGPLVDRRKKVQVPCDLAVTALAPAEMVNPSYLGSFIARAHKLRMRHPLQVVTYDGKASFPLAMAEDKEAPQVEVHSVGFDRGALSSVSAVLANNSTNNSVLHL